jgi:hypothetical protein
MLIDGAEYSGCQTASLTVLDVQVADNDEGRYYCVVTNTAGNTESNTSRSATLRVRQMIGWWKFDETGGSVAADSAPGGGDNSGTVVTLLSNPDNVWSTEGIVDGLGALRCDGWSTWMDTGKYAADLGIDENRERSISVWVYTQGFNNGGIFDVGSRVANKDFCLRTRNTEDQWRIEYWDKFKDFEYPTIEKWVHFVHTHGPEGSKVYADGRMIFEWPGKVLSTGDEFTFRIGHYGPDNEKFNGLIDDVKLYNYVLGPLEVADIYLEVKPDDTVCLSYPTQDISGPDGESDCTVGLSDFALIASEWMECNLVPDCIEL